MKKIICYLDDSNNVFQDSGGVWILGPVNDCMEIHLPSDVEFIEGNALSVDDSLSKIIKPKSAGFDSEDIIYMSKAGLI